MWRQGIFRPEPPLSKLFSQQPQQQAGFRELPLHIIQLPLLPHQGLVQRFQPLLLEIHALFQAHQARLMVRHFLLSRNHVDWNERPPQWAAGKAPADHAVRLRFPVSRMSDQGALALWRCRAPRASRTACAHKSPMTDKNRHTPPPQRNALKGRTGLVRLRNALHYSLDGYRAAWRDEQAFRQIVGLCLPGLVLAGLLCRTWTEGILLILPLILAIVVELCNSAIENVVDRISPEWHPLAKKAKDMGSAAQLTAQLLIAIVWGSYLLARICA